VKYLCVTILFGSFFLACQAYEYTHFIRHGASPAKSLFWATFFVCTGFHGFHVTCGVLALLWVLSKALRGHFDAWGCEAVELVGLYWHFVDLVWIVLFTIIYLV
jgi:heme/copper-type cytochrome/quinol oxidase subunit 3